MTRHLQTGFISMVLGGTTAIATAPKQAGDTKASHEHTGENKHKLATGPTRLHVYLRIGARVMAIVSTCASTKLFLCAALRDTRKGKQCKIYAKDAPHAEQRVSERDGARAATHHFWHSS